MGYFSSKKVYSSDVVTSPIMKNDEIPEYPKLLGIQGIKHPAGSAYIFKDFIANGPAATAKSMYMLANSDPLIGTPKAYKSLQQTDLSSSLQTALNAKHPTASPTLVDYYIAEAPAGKSTSALVDCIVNGFDASDPNNNYIRLSEDSLEINTVHEIPDIPLGAFTHYMVLPPPTDILSTDPTTSPHLKYYRYKGIYVRILPQPIEKVSNIFQIEYTTTYNTYSTKANMRYLLLTPEAAALGATALQNPITQMRLEVAGDISKEHKTVEFKSRDGRTLAEDDLYAVTSYTLAGVTYPFTVPFNISSPIEGVDGVAFTEIVEEGGIGYLPIIPLKQNWSWVDNNPDVLDRQMPLLKGRYPTKAEVYTSIERLMKKTSFELSEVMENLKDTSGGNDPSIYRSVYYGYFADIGSNNEATIEYLYNYFDYLSTVSEYTKTDSLNFLSNEIARKYINSDGTYYTFLFGDNYDRGWPVHRHTPSIFLVKCVRKAPKINEIVLEDNSYKLTLLYNYIEKKTVQGSIGEVGSYTKEITTMPYTYFNVIGYRAPDSKVSDAMLDSSITIVIGNAPFLEGFDVYNLDAISNSYLTIRKQVSENYYEEIIVNGLVHAYSTRRNGLVVRTLEDAAKAERDLNLDRSLYVPIFYQSLSKLSAIERATVLSDTASFIVYAQDYTKVKWYQKASFLRIVQFATIVAFTLVGMPQAGAGIAGLLTFVAELVINILIMYISTQLLKLVIKELGLGATLVVIAIATAIAIFTGDTTLLTHSLGPVGLSISAMTLIGSAAAAAMEVINDNLVDIVEESQEFEDFLKTKQEELEEAQEFLGSDNPDIEYLLISNRPKYVVDKTPEDFYNRTSLLDFAELQDKALNTFYDRALDIDNLYI